MVKFLIVCITDHKAYFISHQKYKDLFYLNPLLAKLS